jgi:hypothetical protein
MIRKKIPTYECALLSAIETQEKMKSQLDRRLERAVVTRGYDCSIR